MRVSVRLCSSFRALVTRGKEPASVETLSRSELPLESSVKGSAGACSLLVRVDYSTVNYKDALVVMGRYPGLRPPMVGGIDLAGTVIKDSSGEFKMGDKILVNGWGLGTDHFGGFAGEARIRPEWAMRLPEGITTKSAASIGTAGYTAMLCVDVLEKGGVTPESGPVLVTGATGGVGSISVLLLSSLGFHVVAVTGKKEEEESYLKELGAKEVLDRSDFEVPPRPLGKEQFSGCVDSCGGVVLANVLSRTRHSGVVSACGLASGMNLNTTMAPFILRRVSIIGVESAFVPLEKRLEVYRAYSYLLTQENLGLVSQENQEISLDEVVNISRKMLEGRVRGRWVVNLEK